MRPRRRNPGIHFLRTQEGGGYAHEPKPAPSPSRHERLEHHGRLPQPGVPTGPRNDQNPATVPPPISSQITTAPTSTPTTSPVRSGSSVIQQISDLLTPGPSARETAEAAHRLGVKAQEPPPSIPDLVSSALHTVSQGADQIKQDVASAAGAATQLPQLRLHSFAGHKTLGAPTVAQVLKAAQKGSTRVNKRGKLTIPATRQAAQGLVAARQKVAQTTGVTGPLTPGQKVFVNHYAKLTGLDPRVVAAQALAEESGGAAAQREAEGNHNWLNIGYFDSGPGAITKQAAWSNPVSAAKAAASFTKGEWGGASTGIQHILASASSSPQRQINAIGNSGWATSAYGDALRRTFNLVGEKSNPHALAALQAAKAEAHNVGIPTKAGDVEQGPQPHTVYVRADAQGFVQWAKALLGTQEGSRLQLKWAGQAGISAAQPWCAAFITAGIERRGLTPPSDPAYSGSWLAWKDGTNIGTDLSHAKPGDVIVFGNSEHIGLYTGGGNVIAGNWSNEVAEYPASEDSRGIQGIIRPHFKGGKVAVQESAVLPGAAIGPGGGIVSGPAGAGESASAAQGGSQRPRPAPSPGYESVPISSLLAVNPLTPGGQPALPKEGPESLVQAILKRRRL